MEPEMRRYLLGSTREEEMQSFEERVFGDEELYAELQAVESELRYDYAEGKLSGDEKRRFEQRYLAAPGGAERVALAKAVLAGVNARGGEAPARRGFAFAWPRLAWAAFALASVFSGWALMELNRTRAQLGQEVARQRSTDAERRELARELAVERERRGELERKVAEKAAAAPLTRFLAFALTPGLTRGVDETKRLSVPAGTDEVRFDLTLRPGFARYRVALTDPDGTKLWSQTVTGGVFVVPARVLKPGDYIIEAEGLPAGVPAGDFPFTVAR